MVAVFDDDVHHAGDSRQFIGSRIRDDDHVQNNLPAYMVPKCYSEIIKPRLSIRKSNDFSSSFFSVISLRSLRLCVR